MFTVNVHLLDVARGRLPNTDFAQVDHLDDSSETTQALGKISARENDDIVWEILQHVLVHATPCREYENPVVTPASSMHDLACALVCSSDRLEIERRRSVLLAEFGLQNNWKHVGCAGRWINPLHE